jgi:hypothetical protein
LIRPVGRAGAVILERLSAIATVRRGIGVHRMAPRKANIRCPRRCLSPQAEV